MPEVSQSPGVTQNATEGAAPPAPPPPPPPPPTFPASPPNSPAGPTPPRHSYDSNTPFPPLPPPPTEAIPLGLGPDGKSLLPKLGLDGKPLKGPPLDKDGKPFPPPPIIGPDGKEIPRPKDDKGRPLPIYVSPEGKPVLDKDGNPIALRFNKEGKPIPLEIEFPSDEPPPQEAGTGMGSPPLPPPPAPPTGTVGGQAEKVPNSVFYVGIADIAISFIVAGVVTYFIFEPYATKDPLWPFLAGSIVVFILGAACGSLPIVASRKNEKTYLWLWCGSSAFLLLIQGGIMFINPEIPIDPGRSIATAFCGLRLISSLCVNFICFSSPSSDQSQQDQQALYYQQQQYSTALQNAYPRENSGYYYHYQEQPNVVVAPQQSTMTTVVHQPVVVQQPIMSYGYAYPGYYGGYGYGGYGYGGGMGFGLGLGLGLGYGGWGGGFGYCPYYDYW